MKTHKKCNGTGIALGHGCGELVEQIKYGRANRKYGLGLSCGCLKDWMKSTDQGRDFAVKQGLSNVRKQETQRKEESNESLKEMRIESYGKENRGLLNAATQKLSRLIDIACGINNCVDCGFPFHEDTSKKFGKANRDAGHYHSKGSNASIAWNLHNLHSQASPCNSNGIGGGKQLGYYEGLISRYGQEYADFVRYDIVRLYPKLGLSNREVFEKLTLVRAIIKNFDTYVISDSLSMRRMFNLIIGIYSE
ncbi:MAG: hypothetical protein ACI9JN_001260 [Bacteroidia bacterium]|jgi:hypothetical protein